MAETKQDNVTPMTVLGAKEVKTYLVTFRDTDGSDKSQFMLVGDNNVIMLDGRALGYSTRPEPAGIATRILRDNVLKTVGKGPAQEG